MRKQKIPNVWVNYNSRISKTISGEYLELHATNSGNPIRTEGVFRRGNGEIGWLHTEMDDGGRWFKNADILEDEGGPYSDKLKAVRKFM